MSTTGQQIIDSVRRELVEPVAGFFTDAELLEQINEAEADFFGRVRSLEGISTTSTVAGRQVYELPSTFIAAKKIFINLPADGSSDDNWVELEPTSLQRLSAEHPNWLSSSENTRGDPQRYMIYEDSLYLHPTPDTTGKEIKLFHKASPDPLESASDLLNTPDSLVTAIQSYVLWQAWLKDQEPQRAEAARQSYFEYVGQGRRFYNRMSGDLIRRFDLNSPDGFTRSSQGWWNS